MRFFYTQNPFLRMKSLVQSKQNYKGGVNMSRNKQVIVRLSDDEFQKLKNDVDLSGLKQSEYLRRCVLQKRIVRTEWMIPLTRQLNHVGINLNQIAKRVNKNEEPMTYDEIFHIRNELETVWKNLNFYLNRKTSSAYDEIIHTREELYRQWQLLNQVIQRVEALYEL